MATKLKLKAKFAARRGFAIGQLTAKRDVLTAANADPLDILAIDTLIESIKAGQVKATSLPRFDLPVERRKTANA